jgi:hypothetical protein
MSTSSCPNLYTPPPYVKKTSLYRLIQEPPKGLQRVTLSGANLALAEPRRTLCFFRTMR